MDIRIRPQTGDMVSVEITCSCGRIVKDPKGNFGRTVIIGAHTEPTLSYPPCICGRTYRLLVQSDHFHVFEQAPRSRP